jgi:hypothetical protein
MITAPISPIAAGRDVELNKPFIWAISFVAALGGLLLGYDWVRVQETKGKSLEQIERELVDLKSPFRANSYLYYDIPRTHPSHLQPQAT